MKYLINNKWVLEINNDVMMAATSEGADTEIGTRSFVQYLKRKMLDISLGSWCLEKLFRSIPNSDVKTAVDYMGGIGRSPLIIDGIFDLKRLTALDIDESCCQIMRANSNGWLVKQADFYKVAGIKCDLSYIGFDTFTLLKLMRLPPNQLDAVHRTFDNSVYVAINDSAIAKMHLNMGVYTGLMGIQGLIFFRRLIFPLLLLQPRSKVPAPK